MILQGTKTITKSHFTTTQPHHTHCILALALEQKASCSKKTTPRQLMLLGLTDLHHQAVTADQSMPPPCCSRRSQCRSREGGREKHQTHSVPAVKLQVALGVGRAAHVGAPSCHQARSVSCSAGSRVTHCVHKPTTQHCMCTPV